MGVLPGKMLSFAESAPMGAGCLPPTAPSHTQLLSFRLTELFFLILIPGGLEAKISIINKSES